MSDGSYMLKKIYEDTRQALLRPEHYFAAIETKSGWAEPIMKALIYGITSGLFILLWSFLDIIGVTEGIFSGDVGVVGFFITIIGAVVGIFVGGFLIIIISYICNGNINFTSALYIAAAVMVFLPLNAFIGIFDGINYVLGLLISLGMNLYGLYMLYTAVTVTLKTEKKPARIIFYVLGGILLLSLLFVLYARNEVRKYNERSGSKEPFNEQQYETTIIAELRGPDGFYV